MDKKKYSQFNTQNSVHFVKCMYTLNLFINIYYSFHNISMIVTIIKQGRIYNSHKIYEKNSKTIL